MATVNLDHVMIHLDYNREKFAEIRRRYRDEVTIDVPAHVGCAPLVSHSNKRTANDIVREYSLETLDDCMARSRHLRTGPLSVGTP